MLIHNHNYAFLSSRYYKVWVYLSIYVASLLAGIFGGYMDSSFVLDLNSSAYVDGFSLFNLFISLSLPIFFFTIGLRFPFSNYLIIFMEGFCRGFCGFSFLRFWGNSAWLMRLLVCFPGIIGNTLLMWLLIRKAVSTQYSFSKDIFCTFFVVILTFIICVFLGNFILTL